MPQTKEIKPGIPQGDNVFTLSAPYVTPAGEELKEVRPKTRFTVRDMREINRLTDRPEDYEIAGVAIMCGLPMEDLLDMDARDYMPLRDRFFDLVGAPKVVS